MNLQQTTEQAIQTLQTIHRDVMSPATKEQIEKELIELAQEAFLLRSCGKDDQIGTGVVTDHVRAVAANAVKTHQLQCKLNATAFYERHSAQALTQH